MGSLARCPCQGSPFDHAAGQLRWVLVEATSFQAHHLQLQPCQFLGKRPGDFGIFCDRRHHVLQHGEAGKQGAALEQHPPAMLAEAEVGRCPFPCRLCRCQTPIPWPSVGVCKPSMVRNKHGFAGARAADDAENLVSRRWSGSTPLCTVSRPKRFTRSLTSIRGALTICPTP